MDGEGGLRCTCGAQQTSNVEQEVKPVEVLKILGEGSQGVVALCRFKQDEEEKAAEDNELALANRDRSQP